MKLNKFYKTPLFSRYKISRNQDKFFKILNLIIIIYYISKYDHASIQGYLRQKENFMGNDDC